MTEHTKEQCITVIGIDLAKRSFHLCGMDAQGRRVFSKQVSRAKLAQELAKVQNKLIVSGHTDAAPYRDSRGYDNWNLSGERALQARSVLVNAGLPAHGILQVSAQADVMPLRPEEPLSGANRRIELLVLTEQAETLYRQLFSENFARYSPGAVDYVQPVTEPADKPR